METSAKAKIGVNDVSDETAFEPSSSLKTLNIDSKKKPPTKICVPKKEFCLSQFKSLFKITSKKVNGIFFRAYFCLSFYL